MKYKSVNLIRNVLPFPIDGVDSASIPLAGVLLVVATTMMKLALEKNTLKSRENIVMQNCCSI